MSIEYNSRCCRQDMVLHRASGNPRKRPFVARCGKCHRWFYVPMTMARTKFGYSRSQIRAILDLAPGETLPEDPRIRPEPV